LTLQGLPSTLEIACPLIKQAQGSSKTSSQIESGSVLLRYHSQAGWEKIKKTDEPSQFERLRYPLRKGTLGKLQDVIADLRGNLQLLLEVFQTEVTTSQTVTLDHLASTVIDLDRKADENHSKE
jgi:hypothetical protein